MDKPYLYNQGLEELAKEVSGNERIHMGIRPFGFHAGNLVSLFVYPYLFCELVEKMNKPVEFTFFVSLNDYEQDALDGPDYKKYPFNIYPKNTSLGATEDPHGCHDTVVDHWTPIIRSSIGKLKKRFPNIQIYFVKNSELKNDLRFKNILLSTLQRPEGQASIYRMFSGREVLPEPIQYAGVVCPICKKTKGSTKVSEGVPGQIEWECGGCGVSLHGNYTDFNYWFYHKPLFTARLNIFKIDITFSGDDHFSEGDFQIRKAFVEYFKADSIVPKMFFAPLVTTVDGDRMSKTRNNTQFGDPAKIIEFCRNFEGNTFAAKPELTVDPISDEDYINFF